MTSNTVNILVNLTQNGPQTAADAGATYPRQMYYYAEKGLVKKAGTVKTGAPGRPAVLWRATDKGRKRAKRILARRAVAA